MVHNYSYKFMAFPYKKTSYAIVVVNPTSPVLQNQNDASSPNCWSISIESNSHPLYVHNNDHPGLVLIAKKEAHWYIKLWALEKINADSSFCKEQTSDCEWFFSSASGEFYYTTSV